MRGIYFGGMKWHCCWRPHAEGWDWQSDFYKEQYISLTSWIFDCVHHFNIFLWSCNKNQCYMYKSSASTTINQATFPLCSFSLISLYLSTSRDPPCPLFCGRTRNHWVLLLFSKPPLLTGKCVSSHKCSHLDTCLMYSGHSKSIPLLEIPSSLSNLAEFDH